MGGGRQFNLLEVSLTLSLAGITQIVNLFERMIVCKMHRN